jgi:hypothetical protein
LLDSSNETILEFRYQDGWSDSADGKGRSLVISNVHAPYDSWSNPSSWTASAGTYGSAALADFDNDGTPNFDEIIAGTDPSLAASKPGFETIQLENSAVKLRLRVFPGRNYRVLFTDSISPGAWSILREISSVASEGIEEISDINPQASARFYFLQIWR